MRRVLITGASSGIGKQLAQDYAAGGWEVIACGRDEEKLMAVAAASPLIIPLRFDITDLHATREALQGRQVDLAILCAGTCEYLDNGVVDAEKVMRVMNTNFTGPVNCLDALLPGLAPGSRVALVGSVAWLLPFARSEAYGASKAALAFFARSLAVDLAKRQIHISLIQPGFVETPLTSRNDFPMPMMVSVTQASKHIRKKLARGDNEIAFPPLFVRLLKVASLLPVSLQQRLCRKMVK
ncbi:SDR family NAD(P)-dependent oxidoreductase [Rahnella sp. C60]|jgi:NAD(P)-dependent dehydrogenase (short-subunit alcohol dehydrogenase family)|uniref:SDR family NAD(P)-dependent oxidoreductase n=1 Tax=Rahnella perminowiae TaxID=2816244 RepID=A0ABS6L6T5_9GAMM|nr:MULTISPECIES: SDR family NAD(P)-dependent oxidoreductase [Rahnella]UJD90246.1 SDR family NAD(P)-dependent oxidoreductase [Rahnella aquatilis]MBU9811522.1 SDR family NAD(P)-dependent oxidoreductase [Rahnella perminowiae]MBU9814110.1 SDR family NAD(P)-dependent oxidoreductase [Rahnella perminowiae]MBU9828161.1 SDR family NAD(P)-dependent oxidoreductase [Rahnella perminowiae]MBU9837561.1 SDR family NAD(P)-dependent oxidoreductase [Rahnella perminowiae]